MPDSSALLAERLKTEGDKTFAFFASINEKQWNSAVYSEGDVWTVRSILVHFVTAEKAFLKLFADIRDGGPGASEEFDIDRYNASQQRKSRDVPREELVEQFVRVRAEMVAFVSALSEADLEKRGRHPYLGHTTLAEMIKMTYRHNQIHYRDLHRILDD